MHIAGEDVDHDGDMHKVNPLTLACKPPSHEHVGPSKTYVLTMPQVMTSARCCRWNTLAAEDTGITLQLLPMLLGFFTYKAAVIAQGALSLLENLAANGATAAEKTTEDLQAADANAAYMQHVLTK